MTQLISELAKFCMYERTNNETGEKKRDEQVIVFTNLSLQLEKEIMLILLPFWKYCKCFANVYSQGRI